jgi:Cu2+-exporting ATPase
MTEVDHSQHQGHVDHAERGHEGHGGHHDHVAQFRRLFWIMVLLAIPTVSFSSMFAMILGYAVPEFPGARWVSPVLRFRYFRTVGPSGPARSARSVPHTGNDVC